jgi:hypothetical protein
LFRTAILARVLLERRASDENFAFIYIYVCSRKPNTDMFMNTNPYPIQIDMFMYMDEEELDGPAVSALGVRWQKLSNVGRSSDG